MKSASIHKKLISGVIGALLLLLCMVGSAAALQGLSSGIFTNAQPSGAVVGGEGTSTITWGTPVGPFPSRLTFTGISDLAHPIDTPVNDLFYIGTLDYYNGTIAGDTGAESVDFQVTVTFFTDLGDEIQTVTQKFELVNTPNIAGDDEASADYVYLHKNITEGAISSDSTFEIDGQQYALHIYGFGEILEGNGYQRVDSFHVFEDDSARAELIGRVTPATCIIEDETHVVSGNIWDELNEFEQYCGVEPWAARDKVTSQTGERITIECTDRQYLLYYYDSEGNRTKVGESSFEGGLNEFVYFYYYENDPLLEEPKCLLRTTHRARDYGEYNDKPNRWTNSDDDDYNDSFLDHAITEYDINSKFRATISEKYFYNGISLVAGYQGGRYFPSSLHNPIIDDDYLNAHGEPEGDKYAEIVDNYDAPPAVEGLPMSFNSNPLCDIDQDGDCDEVDLGRFQNSVGTCRYENGYDSRFDIDGSGCVDGDDHYFLFVQDIDNDGVHDAIDNAPKVPNPDQADSDGDGRGDVVDTFFNVPGDIDKDGDVDRDDADYVRQSLNKPPVYCPECDVDHDGAITILDARKIVTMCTCPRCICCP